MKRPVPVSLLSVGHAMFGVVLLMVVIAALVLSMEGRLPGVTVPVVVLSDNGRVTPLFLAFRLLTVVLGLFSLAVAGGLWKLRNWSRLAAIIETAIFLGLDLVWFAFVVQEPEWRTQNIVTELLILILAGMALLYLLLPSTRRAFQPAS